MHTREGDSQTRDSNFPIFDYKLAKMFNLENILKES